MYVRVAASLKELGGMRVVLRGCLNRLRDGAKLHYQNESRESGQECSQSLTRRGDYVDEECMTTKHIPVS